MPDTVPLATYLWTRVRQLGVGHVLGVPGDMNLELLDYLNKVEGLNWVGNANELNAAYAADGYSRVKGCPGVVVTTMGVGELSALNGIAGAYTEQVKVIHIVGTTSTIDQKNHAMIHHNLGPHPDHRVFEKISSHMRCASAWLDDAQTAPRLLDQAIVQCLDQSLPVYIYVPGDLVTAHVPELPLRSPLIWKPSYSNSAVDQVVEQIINTLYDSRKPIILVDAHAARHQSVRETKRLTDLLDWPVFVAPMGKGIIDETHARFVSVYNGSGSDPGVKEVVESSDCVLNIGPFLADSNTGGFSRDIKTENLIAIHPFSCEVRGKTFENIHIKTVLERLAARLDATRLPKVENPSLPPLAKIDSSSTKITQAWIWRKLGTLLRPHDVLVVEAGTAQFGMPDVKFPESINYITQVYYGSIGYSVGACLGAGLAQMEMQNEGNGPEGRLILIVGDGSLQLSVQEIGTMVKMKLKPIIILINNRGYTIERAIHGPNENYQDIASWRHQSMLEFFGASNSQQSSREVHLRTEFEEILSSPEYLSSSTIQLLEVHMDRDDIPWRLRKQVEIVRSRKNGNS